MDKKCEYCGKPIINGHVVAKIDWVEHVFCQERRVIGVETCIDKFLIQHPVKYRFHYEYVVQ